MWKVPMDERIKDVTEYPEDDRVMLAVVAAR